MTTIIRGGKTPAQTSDTFAEALRLRLALIGGVAGSFTDALPTGTIATDKVYQFGGTNATDIGGITWYNGDSALYNGSTWTRIPFQSLANYPTKAQAMQTLSATTGMIAHKAGTYANILQVVEEKTSIILTVASSYVKKSDGSVASIASSSRSDLLALPVTATTCKITSTTVGTSVASIAFYTSGSVFISANTGVANYGDIETLTIPATATQYRCTRYNTAGYTFNLKFYAPLNYVVPTGTIAYFEDNYLVNKVISALDTTSPTYLVSNRNTTTFIGSVNTIIDAMLALNPTQKIVFVGHNNQDGQTGNKAMKPIVDIQQIIAEYWQVPLIRTWENMGFAKKTGVDTLTTFLTDGTHPASNRILLPTRYPTVDLLAQYLTEQIRPIFSNWTGKKILWLGTSIPAGFPYASDPNSQYPLLIATALGCTCVNLSESGSVVRLTKVDGSAIGAYPSLSDPLNTPNYIDDLLPLFGTGDQPDIVFIDHGRNDFVADPTDFDVTKWG